MKGTLKDLRKIAKTSGMIRYSSLSKSKLQIALATHLAGNNQHSNDKASRKTSRKRKASRKTSRKRKSSRKIRKPKKSRKTSRKRKSSRKIRKPKKSRKQMFDGKVVTIHKSRKVVKKSRKAPPSGIIKKENLDIGKTMIGMDGNMYEVVEITMRGKKVRKWRKIKMKFMMYGRTHRGLPFNTIKPAVIPVQQAISYNDELHLNKVLPKDFLLTKIDNTGEKISIPSGINQYGDIVPLKYMHSLDGPGNLFKEIDLGQPALDALKRKKRYNANAVIAHKKWQDERDWYKKWLNRRETT